MYRSNEELEGRHDELKSDRSIYEPKWRLLAGILRPDERDLSAPNELRQDEGPDTYDSTPLYALDNFVGGLFGEATNPAERWFEFDLPDKDLKEFGPVKEWLWNEAAATQASLGPQVSAFYNEVPAWFADMAAFGFGAMYQEEWVGQNIIIDRATPIGRLYIGRDAAGRADTMHYEMPLKGRQIKKRWPRVPDDVRDDGTFTVLHCVHPNDSYDPRRVGRAAMRFASTFFSCDIKNWRVDAAYNELPYHLIEWDRRSGRNYARGPGHNALPDMEMLDEMGRSVQLSLQFEAEPVWLTSNESAMTAADLVPSAVIEGGISESGKEMAKRLDRGEQLTLPMAEREAIRNQIREAFQFSLFQLINRPQMTAQEFNGWKEERLKLAAPHLVKVQTGLATFITRRFNLRLRMGLVRPPPPELANQGINIEFVSPFAKALKLARARGAQQLIGVTLQAKELDPEAADEINVGNCIRAIHDGVSSDPSLIRDPREVAAIRQRRAAALQQQVQLEQLGQAVDVAATASHAVQASTLANSRNARRT